MLFEWYIKIDLKEKITTKIWRPDFNPNPKVKKFCTFVALEDWNLHLSPWPWLMLVPAWGGRELCVGLDWEGKYLSLSAKCHKYSLQSTNSFMSRPHKLFNDQNIAGDNFHLQFPHQPHTEPGRQITQSGKHKIYKSVNSLWSLLFLSTSMGHV